MLVVVLPSWSTTNYRGARQDAGGWSIMGGLRAAVALLLLAGTAAAQPAERRVALVIGNGQYQHVSRLANPTSDV